MKDSIAPNPWRVAGGAIVYMMWVLIVWWAMAIMLDPIERARAAQILSRIFYRVAARIGRAGMAAEKAYWDAIEKARV